MTRHYAHAQSELSLVECARGSVGLFVPDAVLQIELCHLGREAVAVGPLSAAPATTSTIED